MTDRLELTWPNKDRFLLSPRDADGKPVWVERTHPGAVEVRGHEFTGEYGEVGADPYADNLLITGDSYDALRMLCEVPEFRRHYRGKVKLVYIDPPFNTGQTFANYDDWLDHSTWLSLIRDRLPMLRDLLASDGSIWVNVDDQETHRVRLLLDEVFGVSNFVTTVYWLRKDTRANDARLFSPNTDTIHVYAKDVSRWQIQRLPRPASMDSAYKNPDGDPRGPWLAAQLYAKSGKGSLSHTFRGGQTWTPPPGKFPAFSAARLDDLDADGRIYFGKDGNAQPTLKQFLAEVKDGVVPTNNWHYDEVGSNRHSRLEQKALFPGDAPFVTAKPERLLHRIIHLTSVPGDIVLDCFAGSGTTPAVAHKMGRRWIAVELSDETVSTFAAPRVASVVRGEDPGGVTADLDWTGGGSFRTVSVLPSIYDVGPGDAVVVNIDAGDRRVPRAVASQLGFEYAGEPPFIGRRGRMRLAYAPGAVGPEDTLELAAALGADERLTLVAMAVLPGAEAALLEASPGSRVLKLPRDVLAARRRRGDAR